MSARTCPRRRGDELGISMVEVLVGMALMSFIALSAAPLLVMGVRLSTVSEDITLQLTVGEAKMEELRNLEFTDPGLAAGGSLTTNETGFFDAAVDGDTNRYLRWKIEDVGIHMKRISVLAGSVASEIGPPRSITLEAYRTDLK